MRALPGAPAGPGDRRPVILLVEDEAIIRMMAAEDLRAMGYEVVEAGHAADAVRLLEGGGPFDLLLTDIRMPGEMDGLALARWARDFAPGLPVLLTSGVSPGQHREAGLGELPFVPKPYVPARIGAAIRRLLGE